MTRARQAESTRRLMKVCEQYPGFHLKTVAARLLMAKRIHFSGLPVTTYHKDKERKQFDRFRVF